MADLRRIAVPVADLLSKPSGVLERQLLFGEAFTVETEVDGYAIGQRPGDGYKGAIAQADLRNWSEPTHRVVTNGAHVYEQTDIKTQPRQLLPFLSDVTVVREDAQFAELAGGGFVHSMQIAPIVWTERDFTSIARRFLGIPYLWGGNSQFGIDCSGLISACLRAAKRKGPADSGPQSCTLGRALEENEPLQRNDLIFWAGHVGLMTSETMLVHANGYHMACVEEPLTVAAERILSREGKPITIRRRI